MTDEEYQTLLIFVKQLALREQQHLRRYHRLTIDIPQLDHLKGWLMDSVETLVQKIQDVQQQVVAGFASQQTKLDEETAQVIAAIEAAKQGGDLDAVSDAVEHLKEQLSQSFQASEAAIGKVVEPST